MDKSPTKNPNVANNQLTTKRKAKELPVEVITPIVRFLPTPDFVGFIGLTDILPRWEDALNIELKQRLPFSVKVSRGFPYEYGCSVSDRSGNCVVIFEHAQEFLKSSIYELVEELCIPLYIYTDNRDVDWNILEEVYLGLPSINSLVIEPRSWEDFDPQSSCPQRNPYGGGRGPQLEIPLSDVLLNCEEFVAKFSPLLPRLKSFKLAKSQPELGYEVRLLRIVALVRQMKKLEALDITVKRFGYVMAERIPQSEIYALPAIEMDCLKSLKKLVLLAMEPIPGVSGCVFECRPGQPDLPTFEMLQFIASHCTALENLAMVFSASYYDREHRDMAHYFAAFRQLAQLRILQLKVKKAHQWNVKQDGPIVPHITDLRLDVDAHITGLQTVAIASKFSGVTSFTLQPHYERPLRFSMLNLWETLSRLADQQTLPRLENLKVVGAGAEDWPAYHHADFTAGEISYFTKKLSIRGTFDLSQFHFYVFFYDRELTDLYRAMQSNTIACLKLRGLVTQQALIGFRDFLADFGGSQSFRWISGESSRKSAPSEFVWAPEFYDCVTNFKFSGTKTSAVAADNAAIRSFTVEIHSSSCTLRHVVHEEMVDSMWE